MDYGEGWRAWLPVPFLPALCPVCGGRRDQYEYLCRGCAASLEGFRLTEPTCRGCGVPLFGEGQALCFRCAQRESLFRGRALFLYRDAVRTVMRRFKFEGCYSRAWLIAEEIAGALGTLDTPVIVPVPSSRVSRRRSGRGHMERVAGCLARMDYTVEGGILRRRRTEQQKYLDPERRRANMLRAFRAHPRAAGLDLMLIDDLRTTGATIDAAATALCSAGARSVRWITFAID